MKHTVLRNIKLLTGSGIGFEFGDYNLREWINARGGKRSCQQPAFSVLFFGSGWRVLKEKQIYTACYDFECEKILTDLITKNEYKITKIDRLNLFDYQLFFSNKIIFETFLLERQVQSAPLYLVNAEGDEEKNINALCPYIDSSEI